MFDINTVKNVAVRSANRGLLLTKKYSPEILTGVGIVGIVTAGVLGAKATLKLEPVVDHIHSDLNTAKFNLETENEYTNKDYKRDTTKAYAKGVIDITKLYGAPLSLGIGSIGCILAAHGIMRRRNVALVAAYNVLEKSFVEYRKRVVEEFGIDKDVQFARGVRTEEVKNEETGKTETVSHIDPNGLSPYAKFFDETCSQWSKNPEYNMMTLKSRQNWANDLLKIRGHVFLNEVYTDLGIPHTKQGAVVGWVLNKDSEGDNFVDFGIYDFHRDSSRRFVNGHDDSILLDFNVNGVILDLI